MSQLVKLKASLPTHLIRPTTLASAILGHNQPTTNGQQRSANSINRRGLTTNAHKAQQQHNTITHAASSQSHSSSSSSSSSSFTSSLLFGLLGLGAVGGAFLANQETVHAEAASDPLALPAINLDSDASVSSVGVTTTKKKSGGRKKTKQRKQLDYPGKLAKLHQFNEQLVEVRVGQGFRFQLQASAYPHDPLADKTVVLIPICELGGPQGPLMQWIASTSLGRKHSFEGYSDSAGNSSGHYKYTSDAGFSIKPSFQLSAHGNVAVLDMDYKRKEQAYTLNVNTTGDITTTFNQSLTPNLVGGVELHFAPMGFVHLNGGAKYTTADKVEQYVFTKKDAKMMARLVEHTCLPSSYEMSSST